MSNAYKTLIRAIYFDDKKAKFCVDYYFPTEFYEDFIPFVQSSIASTQNSYQIIISQEWKRQSGLQDIKPWGK